MRSLIYFLLGSVLLQASVWSVDIAPSRKVVPDKFRNPPGKRYNIFAGDPERVQRANEVNIKDFDASLTVDPPRISLSSEEGEIVAKFVIRNKSDRNYTLSFPDAQRYDLALVTLNDDLIYLWSADKKFVQETGMSFLNGGEMVQFTQALSLNLLKEKCSPGSYKIAMILSNYPELKGAQTITIAP
ncbi:MAG: BsuPI-related putative proteinase inhibitor [Verrucomicrobiota bacterium]